MYRDGESSKLDEATEARISDAIWSILSDVARQGPSSMSTGNLAGGSAGTALLFGYAAHVLGEPDLASYAHQYFDHALHWVATHHPTISLFGGLTGVAWVGCHLENSLGIEMLDRSDLDDFDRRVRAELRRRACRPDPEVELMRGAAGVGIYGLERVRSGVDPDLVEAAVEVIGNAAIRTACGTAWITPKRRLSAKLAGKWPLGIVNLGAAHGVPGILSFLSQAVGCSAKSEEVELLAREGFSFLKSMRVRPSPGRSHYPSYRPRVERLAFALDSGPARLAWCYGDPGVGGAYLTAGISLHDESLRKEACELAACVDVEAAIANGGLHDGGLCHGTSGLIIFLSSAAAVANGVSTVPTRLFQHLLDTQRRGGRGPGGFGVWNIMDIEAETWGWQHDSGFLGGSAGIALALLSILDPSRGSGWKSALGMHPVVGD